MNKLWKNEVEIGLNWRMISPIRGLPQSSTWPWASFKAVGIKTEIDVKKKFASESILWTLLLVFKCVEI